MHANPSPETPEWGFFSPEGFFQPLSALTVRQLPFVCKSVPQLEEEMRQHLEREGYETCALIRDELTKRYDWLARQQASACS
jgi:hypothetical protein